MTFIDAHQHVWDPACARYDWLTAELAPINRAIDFAELRPALREAGVDATVLVQSADNDDDTDLMLRTAEANPEVAAVVAYVPLARPAADRTGRNRTVVDADRARRREPVGARQGVGALFRDRGQLGVDDGCRQAVRDEGARGLRCRSSDVWRGLADQPSLRRLPAGLGGAVGHLRRAGQRGAAVGSGRDG